MSTIKLIAGDFTPEEAKVVLLNMIESKITFHKQASFSNFARFGEASLKSELRIKELKEAKKQIIALLQEADENNNTLKIESSIVVSLETKATAEIPVQECELVEY